MLFSLIKIEVGSLSGRSEGSGGMSREVLLEFMWDGSWGLGKFIEEEI